MTKIDTKSYMYEQTRRFRRDLSDIIADIVVATEAYQMEYQGMILGESLLTAEYLRAAKERITYLSDMLDAHILEYQKNHNIK